MVYGRAEARPLHQGYALKADPIFSAASKVLPGYKAGGSSVAGKDDWD
jgi:hypothetical protein